jgi:2'-5' RNA ligase
MLQFAPTDELRLFFAVPLAESLRAPVEETQTRLASARAKVNWVDPGNLHFTLKFLGAVLGQAVPGLAQAAARVAVEHRAFALHVGGCGAFPRANDAKTIWVGCDEGADKLTALANDLDEALAAAGLAVREERPFQAHLTLGRNKSAYHLPDLGRAIQREAHVDIGHMLADHFVLLHSSLSREGPEYTELQRFSLSAPGLQ